ncbi:hypothetical protein ACIRCZ_19465 [Leifsonia sp. NPDC102414]|uniref:hypothetical protein n=1 Tax=Leifsonia sp. NPDC102414 TaxID=3364124 RepID=UPI003812213A
MNSLLIALSKPLYNIPPITPVAGGPGYSAAQKIAGQILGVFLIIAAIAILIAMVVGVFSWKTHHGGGLKGSLTAMAVVIMCVIIAASAAQIINWGQAIPLFG